MQFQYSSLKKATSLTVLFLFLILQILPFFPSSIQDIPLIRTLKKSSIFSPSEIDAAGLSSASATLANPRLSFDAITNGNIAVGGNVAVTQASGTVGDYDTRNLFPGDSIVIGANAAIPVGSVSADLVTFILRSGLTSGATAGSTRMTVAQSGTMTIRFYTATAIPLGGSIKVIVPANATNNNDGLPDSSTTITTNGFDRNSVAAGNITCPGGFTGAAISTAGSTHTITCNNAGGAVPAGANITLIVGSGGVSMINPAPLNGRPSNQRGIADVYTIAAATYSGTAGAGSLVEDILMKIAPVEGVLVTATVDETLQFTVAGVAAAAGTYCGKIHSTGISTTATSVPWGTISSGYSVDKNEAVQQLIVTTNAASGYKVYAEENDQMGLEGTACIGSAGANADNPTSGDFTFTGKTCIRDVAGGSNNALFDWGTTPASIYGFGYAIQNNVGTDASTGVYTNGGMIYGARAFSDMQNTEDKYTSGAELMTNSGPVSASAVYVCYRINIPGTQPAGYYYNKIKYTAVPKF